MNWKKILLLATIVASAFILNSCRSLQPVRYQGELLEFSMEWEGYERSYILYVPPVTMLEANPPVLFHLHGGGGTARGTVGLTFGRFNELADSNGFLVVYPQAVGKNWNDGRKLESVKAWNEDIDDVGFIVAVLNEIGEKYNIDRDRIFTTGMSNGGFMSSRLLCDRADVFRGAAILTASLSVEYLSKCNPSRPAAILLMNGTDDPLVPYDGGQVKVLGKARGEILSTDEYLEFWKDQNACTEQITTVKLPDTQPDGTRVIIKEYGSCDEGGALILYSIEGGGHTWPGGKQYLGERIIGKTSKEINACDVIWDFFESL